MEAHVNVTSFADRRFYDDWVDIIRNTRFEEPC